MNDFFQKITKKLIKIFNTGQEQDIKLRDVTPKKIKRNTNNAMDQYIKRLHTEIKKKDVYNIAVSGGYGSGKTTIVTNYINEYPKCKNTIISLESFFEYEVFEEKLNTDNKGQTNTVNKEQSNNILTNDERTLVDKIEKSILKQLAYVNKEQDCPDSNILRVRTFNIKDLLLYFSIIYIVLSFLYYKFFSQINSFIKYIITFNTFNNINNLIDKFVKNDKLIFILLCLASIIFIVCSIYILIVFCRYFQINAKSISLKINGSEVKFEDEGDLTFTRQLKEIIYAFNVNKYNVIFFEDIDRFSDDVALKVIEELKELNKIINQFMNDKVTFVYLFKDKILRTHENKGKFYDYSLSVLPISTKYNSLINLNDILDSVSIEDEIDDNLKVIASKYIIDYRSLVNLVGDYDLFRNIIGTSNYNKLFAMVLFKNYYVIEYDEILSKDNIIEKRFKTIDDKKENLKKINKEKINILNKEIAELSEYKKNSIKELKELLIYTNSRVNNSTYTLSEIIIDNKSFNIDEFLNDEFDLNLLKNCSTEKFYRNGYGSYNINYDSFENKNGFFNRINNDTTLVKKEEQVELLNSENEEIDRMCISEAFNKYYLDNESTNLIDELISSGYIDNDYVDYITSPPAEDGVTNEDVNFIFSVTHKEYAFDKEIHNCDYVLKHLKKYLSTPYILNINFINYLMENNHIDEILKQFINLTPEKVNFLLKYMQKDLEGYLNFCDKLWEKKIILWNNYQSLKKNKEIEEIFAYDLLNHKVKREDIDKIEDLKNIIYTDFSDISNLCKNQETIIENLININAKFPSIKIFSGNFRNSIYKNNLYILNEENINILIKSNIMKIPFNSIGNQNVLDYIYNNINEFFRDFYMENKSFKFDDSKIIKDKVLCNLDNEEYIKEVYKREEFIISVNKIPKNFINYAIEYNHINPIWGNVNKLYNEETKHLISNFIYRNKQALFYKKKSINELKKVKTTILFKTILFINDEEDNDIINIIAQNCYSPTLRQYYIPSKENSYYETLIANNLINFSDSTLKDLLKIDVANTNVYLDNWYKENKETMFNAVSKNKEAFKMMLKSKKVTDDDKFSKIRLNKKGQLALMNEAFGDGKEHIIYSKSMPKIFESLKDKIEIINSDNESYTFRMK